MPRVNIPFFDYLWLFSHQIPVNFFKASFNIVSHHRGLSHDLEKFLQSPPSLAVKKSKCFWKAFGSHMMFEMFSYNSVSQSSGCFSLLKWGNLISGQPRACGCKLCNSTAFQRLCNSAVCCSPVNVYSKDYRWPGVKAHPREGSPVRPSSPLSSLSKTPCPWLSSPLCSFPSALLHPQFFSFLFSHPFHKFRYKHQTLPPCGVGATPDFLFVSITKKTGYYFNKGQCGCSEPLS